MTQERRRGERRGADRRALATPVAMLRELHGPLRVLVYLLIALSLILIYENARFLVDRIASVLLLFIFAAIIAMLLNPLVDAIQQVEFFRERRGLAVLAMNVVLAGVVSAVLVMLIPLIATQGSSFGQQAPALVAKVQGMVHDLEVNLNQRGLPVQFGLPSDLGTLVGPAVGSAFNIVSQTIGTIVNLILITVIVIYLEIEGRQLIAAARQVFPRRQRLFDFTLVAAGSTLAGYVRGQVIFAVVMATFTGVALSIIGVHFAMVIAVITFFLELVPLAGAPIAMLLAVAVAATQTPLVLLLTVVFSLGGHLVGAYTIGLKVMSQATRVHPLVALGALLVGAELGGILGALFAVPIAGILNVYLGAIYRARRGEVAFTLPDSSVHEDGTLDQLPRLGEEISQMAEEHEISKTPIPRAVPKKRTPRTKSA